MYWRNQLRARYLALQSYLEASLLRPAGALGSVVFRRITGRPGPRPADARMARSALASAGRSVRGATLRDMAQLSDPLLHLIPYE